MSQKAPLSITFAKFLIYAILFNSTNYLIFSNFYVINILFNILGKKAYIDHPSSMLLNSFFI